jgi:hypothetical protein
MGVVRENGPQDARRRLVYARSEMQVIPPMSTGAGTRLSTQSGTHFFGGTTSPLIPVRGCP